MTLEAYLSWNCLDKTLYWNERLRSRSNRGIFNGGLVTPVAGQLKIDVGDDLFAAVSYDGMIVRDDAGVASRLNVSSDPFVTTVLWVVCYAKYLMLYDPIIQYQVLTDADYSAHPEQDYCIVLARLNIPAAAIEVSAADIDYTVRDVVDPAGRHTFRGAVATFASLPTATPTHNRDGDVYMVVDVGTIFRWDVTTTSWISLGGSSASAGEGIFHLAEQQKTRSIEQSGVVTDLYYDTDTPTVGDDWEGRVPVLPEPTTDDVFNIENLTALVHGHYLHIPYTTVTLSAAPGAGTRWDGVWLEVWREVVDPTTATFDDAIGGTKTFAQVLTIFETMQNSAKLDTNSVYVYSVESVGSGVWVATFFSIRSAASIAATAYANPDDLMTDAAVLNIGGLAWGKQTGALPLYDDGTWFANYGVSYDGVSWGIPLFVVRRVDYESTPNAIEWVRGDDGLQQIFEVYPRTRSDVTKRASRSLERSSSIVEGSGSRGGTNRPWQEQFKQASGVLRGHQVPIVGKLATGPLGANEIRVPDMNVSIDGHLFDLFYQDVDLGASGIISGHRRDLVLLVLTWVKYQWPTADNALKAVGQRSPIGYGVTDDQGYRYFPFLEYVTYDVGSALNLNNALATIGGTWTYAARSELQSNTDHGLLTSTSYSDSSYRVPLNSNAFAIPIALIHRRNEDTWAADTNPNGAKTSNDRPDGYQHNVIEKVDILDLRQYVVQRDGELEYLVQESMDRMLQGRLRTSMVQHPVHADCAGVVHLYNDVVSPYPGAGPPPGYSQLPASYDDARLIWSNAEENQLVASTFMLVSDGGVGYEHVDPRTGAAGPTALIEMHWAGAGMTGTIDIVAPLWSHLGTVAGGPSPVWAHGGFYYQDYTLLDNPIVDLNAQLDGYGWATIAADARGNPIHVQVTVPIIDAAAIFDPVNRFWVEYVTVYPRGLTGDADSYDDNRGTFGNQDKLVKVFSTGTTSDFLVEPPIAYINQHVVGPVSTVAFTAAELEAAAGVPAGTLLFCGISDSGGVQSTQDLLDGFVKFPRLSIVGRSRADWDITKINLSAIGTVTFTLNVVLTNEDVELVFPYTRTGAVDETSGLWWEMGRGSRALLGAFGWAVADITVPAGHVPGNSFYINTDLFTLPYYPGHPSPEFMFFKSPYEGVTFQVWRDAGAGTFDIILIADYNVINTLGGFLLQTPYTNVLEFSDATSTLTAGDLIRVFAVVWVPPVSAFDDITVDYLGTPYHGTSDSLGGFQEDHFFGEVKAVTDIVRTTLGPGTKRFSTYVESLTLPEIVSSGRLAYYQTINPALTYLPVLDGPDFTSWDVMLVPADLYYNTPQINSADLTYPYNLVFSEWYLLGNTLDYDDLANEVAAYDLVIDRQRANFMRGVAGSTVLPSDVVGRVLRPGALILKPTNLPPRVDGHDTNIVQGQYYEVRTPGSMLDLPAFKFSTLHPGMNQETIDLFQHYMGTSLDVAGSMAHYETNRKWMPFSVAPRLQVASVSELNNVLLGYLVRTFTPVFDGTDGNPGIMFVVWSSRLKAIAAQLPGGAFDSFFPLYRPLLPADEEAWPPYL